MAKNTTNMVSVDSLVFEDNIRTDNCMNLPAMVDSIKRHGFKVNHPLVVSKRGEDSYLVLCGNRRGLALIHLRDNEPEAFGEALASGKVPAVVHEGLSPEQEVLLRIDHSTDEDREPLDEWSQFQAIRQLVLIGLDSQEGIANKLGIFHTKGKNKGQPNRSFIQPRVNLARLPQFVQDEMRVYCDNPKNTAMRWSKLATLYKLYNKEFSEHPNGNGPEFSKAWDAALVVPPKVEKASDNTHALTAKDAAKRAQACSSSLLRDALLTVTGQGSIDLATIDKAIKEAQDAQTAFNALKEYHGDGAFDDFVKEAIDAISDREAIETE